MVRWAMLSSNAGAAPTAPAAVSDKAIVVAKQRSFARSPEKRGVTGMLIREKGDAGFIAWDWI